MSKRWLCVLMILWLCIVPAMGQDTSSEAEAGYQEALRRIEEARVSRATTLDLSNIIPLRTIPPEIIQLKHLRDLTIQNNHGEYGLTILSAEIGQLRDLEHLTISNTSIPSLPAEIGQLKKLKHLGLALNPLSELPPEIGNLTQLEILDLRWTNITTLPPEIGQLTHLKLLFLSDSPLILLPSEIGQLKNLEIVYVNNTSLEALPAEVGQLSKLVLPSLENTSITTLPIELGQLTYVDLGINASLTFPPPEIVAQGTPAILAYLRDYHAMLMRQTIAAIAVGVGGIALLILAFRWRQRGLQEKKKCL